MSFEFEFLTDVYSAPDKAGRQKIVKANVVYKEVLDCNTDIKRITQYVRPTGTIDKKKCIFILDDDSQRICLLPYDQAKYLKMNKPFKQLGSK